MSIRWLSVLFGQHPNSFTEARYRHNRGILRVDRVFLWVDLALSLMTLLAVSQYNDLLAWLLITLRTLRAGWVANMLRRLTVGSRIHGKLYFVLVVLAMLEAPALVHLQYVAEATLRIEDTMLAHLLPLSAMIMLHPLDTRARLAACIITAISYLGFMAQLAQQTSDPDLLGLGWYGGLLLISSVIVSALLEWQRRDSHRQLVRLNRALAQKNHALAQANNLSTRRQIQLEQSIHWQRDALLTNVARGIVHEIAQPIATASNASYSLNRSIDSEDARQIDANLARIRQYITRYRELFLRRGQGEPGDRFCLVKVIEEAMELVSDRDRLWIEISVDVKETREIDLEALAVVMIFTNLFNNAGAAGRRSGDRVAVQVTSESENDYVNVIVCNDGPPIDTSTKENLFQSSVVSSSGGTGIGLGLSRTLLSSSGGTIELKSSNPVCFELSLPLKK